jgi:hypothetical protein
LEGQRETSIADPAKGFYAKLGRSRFLRNRGVASVVGRFEFQPMQATEWARWNGVEPTVAATPKHRLPGEWPSVATKRGDDAPKV